MEQVLTAHLRSKFPKLVPNGFSFDCGDGWYTLIDAACSLIQYHIDLDPSRGQTVFAQVKEKFGTLRLYTDGYLDEYISGVIDTLEFLSGYTCEVTGDKGSLHKSGVGWIRTLSEVYAKEHGWVPLTPIAR